MDASRPRPRLQDGYHTARAEGAGIRTIQRLQRRPGKRAASGCMANQVKAPVQGFTCLASAQAAKPCATSLAQDQASKGHETILPLVEDEGITPSGASIPWKIRGYNRVIDI